MTLTDILQTLKTNLIGAEDYTIGNHTEINRRMRRLLESTPKRHGDKPTNDNDNEHVQNTFRKR